MRPDGADAVWRICVLVLIASATDFAGIHAKQWGWLAIIVGILASLAPLWRDEEKP